MSIYIVHYRKITPLTRSMCRVLFKKKRRIATEMHSDRNCRLFILSAHKRNSPTHSMQKTNGQRDPQRRPRSAGNRTESVKWRISSPCEKPPSLPRVTMPNFKIWSFKRSNGTGVYYCGNPPVNWVPVSRHLRSFKVVGTFTDRSGNYDFLSVIYSNHGPTA